MSFRLFADKLSHLETDQPSRSFYFLFQIIEYEAIEELPKADVKAIANLLDRDDARILAFDVQHAVYCGG